MGKRGPKPKPTVTKKLEGNPGKRKLNDKEPQPPPLRIPVPPDWLNDDARAEFRRLAPTLQNLGLLSELDLVALANYCQCYGLFLQCNQDLQNEGTTTLIETQNGQYVASLPQFNQAMKLLQQMRQWGAEFGLSPSARSGLIPDQKQSPKSSLTDFAQKK